MKLHMNVTLNSTELDQTIKQLIKLTGIEQLVQVIKELTFTNVNGEILLNKITKELSNKN